MERVLSLNLPFEETDASHIYALFRTTHAASPSLSQPTVDVGDLADSNKYKKGRKGNLRGKEEPSRRAFDIKLSFASYGK